MNSKRRSLSKKALWDMTPQAVKASFGRLIGMLPVRFTLGKKFTDHMRFLSDAQWWPAERMRDYQVSQLRRMCKLAYEKTQYYRRAFDEAGFNPEDLRSIDDLRRLPTIDKQTVIQHTEDMCTAAPGSPGVDYGSTSGSSGTPLHFYLSANRSSIEYAYLVTNWARVGYSLNTSMVVIRKRMVKPDRTGLRHEYDPLLRHHYYSNLHMSDENMGRYLEHIATIGPCFLHVYPSSASALARFIVRAGRAVPDNIKAVLVESEIVYPDQRRFIEEVFGRRCFSCYGHSEKLVMAAGCEHSDNYHVWPTYGYFELLDEDGNEVTTPGQRGEIVGTGFINTVMPFIRYRTDDWATYVAERCDECGREHKLIADIRGHRIQEVLITADGTEISWTALNTHDDTFSRVHRFQFYQDTPGQAVLKVVPAEGFDDSDVDRMRRNLERKFDGQINFKIKFTENVNLSRPGKAIYVDQRIPRPHVQSSRFDLHTTGSEHKIQSCKN